MWLETAKVGWILIRLLYHSGLNIVFASNYMKRKAVVCVKRKRIDGLSEPTLVINVKLMYLFFSSRILSTYRVPQDSVTEIELFKMLLSGARLLNGS